MRTWIIAVALAISAPIAHTQAPPAGHALGNPKKDPGGWPKGDAASGLPDVRGGTGTWWWGDLAHGRSYQTSLKVTNNCEKPETVTIFINSLPLQAPSTVLVPGNGSIDVAMTITIDKIPESSLPRPRGDAYVAGNIDGSVVIWHPWTSKCMPRRDEYTTGGHIIAAGPPDAQKVGGDPCHALQGLGLLPSTFEEKLRAARGERLAPEDEKKCAKDLNEVDANLRNEIQGMAAADPSLESPGPVELQHSLESLSTTQLVAVRDELLARAGRQRGGL